MHKRTLGRSGIEVGEIGLGTWGLSGESYGRIDPDYAKRTIEIALDEGTNFIDTAGAYGPDGAVEMMIGDVLESRDRDSVLVCTRIGVDRDGEAGSQKFFDRISLDELTAMSLKRMKLDHVDVLLLHNPLPETLKSSEPMQTLAMLRKSGRTRLIGASVSSITAGKLALAGGADVIMLPYNALFPKLMHKLAADIATSQAGVLVRSPLAYGLLGGAWHADQKFTDDDHRGNRWGPAELARRVRQRESLRLAMRNGQRTMAEAAIRFVLSNSMVSCCVVGSRTPEMARSNAHACDERPALSDEELNTLGERLQEEGIEF